MNTNANEANDDVESPAEDETSVTAEAEQVPEAEPVLDAESGDEVEAEAGAEAEPIEEPAPIVGSSADLGEPYTGGSETFQVGVDVTESQVPPETGVAILQDATGEAPLPATNEAIGTGPTDLVEVPVEEEEPSAGLSGVEEAAALVTAPADVSTDRAAETADG